MVKSGEEVEGLPTVRRRKQRASFPARGLLSSGSLELYLSSREYASFRIRGLSSNPQPLKACFELTQPDAHKPPLLTSLQRRGFRSGCNSIVALIAILVFVVLWTEAPVPGHLQYLSQEFWRGCALHSARHNNR